MKRKGFIMTPDHKEWEEFYAILTGPEGCNFREDEKKEPIWDFVRSIDSKL